MRKLFVPLFVAFALTACADDLRDDGGTDPPVDGADAGATPGNVTHTDNGDGTTTTVVDATDAAVWIYLDLETGDEAAPADPGASDDWDLGFRRFEIKLNGGVSGAGGVQVAALPGADFDALAEAPAQPAFATDAPDGDDDDGDPDLVMSTGQDAWYDYDPTTHVLTPRDIVYVVRTVEGGYFKLRVLDYYDDAGTSGFLAFQWGPIAAPPGSQTLTVDASDPQAMVYLSVVAGGVAVVDDPASSTDWDLGIARTMFATNGGTSGGGLAGARIAPNGADYDAVAAAPTTGFAADAMLPVPGPPGSGEFSGNPVLNAWYDYDPATHTVTSKGETYLIRTAGGDYGKLTIADYDGGVYQLRLDPVEREVVTETSVLDASDAEAWLYVSFRAGDVVAIEDPAADPAWDLALSRTNMRTNSGTSGAGAGGAVEVPEPELGAVTAAPAEGYAVDQMVPIPGPPGSGEQSANPVLATWYDYDPVTHTVSPRDTSFVIRTADGGFAKLAVTDYAAGVLTVRWAYAGAGESTFAE